MRQQKDNRDVESRTNYEKVKRRSLCFSVAVSFVTLLPLPACRLRLRPFSHLRRPRRVISHLVPPAVRSTRRTAPPFLFSVARSHHHCCCYYHCHHCYCSHQTSTHAYAQRRRPTMMMMMVMLPDHVHGRSQSLRRFHDQT